jgi:acyl-coenzyme A synthetase/AMP-(fatty) acid ligase
VTELPREPPPAGAANILVLPGWRGTWAEVEPIADVPAVAAYLVADNLGAARAVWSHVRRGGEMLLVAASRVDEALRQDLRQDGFALLCGDARTPPSTSRLPEPGRVWLLTSGSTGRPKRVAHSLASLSTVSGDQPPRRWLCAYSPGAYAWWQVVTLSLAHPGQDIVFLDPADLDDWPQVALAEGVTAVSGTPTFWRQALWRAGETVAALPLEQLTLGGEPVDQVILDRLGDLFPQARISWIYASSEAGATIAVHDRRAGFPVEWLARSAPGRPRLAVADGELVIDSPWSAGGMAGPLRTGDRVDVVDGRVQITGRLATDEINVGGSKVSAAEVRAVLLDHPDVAWAQVRGRRAPLVGQMVVAEVVLSRPSSPESLSRWSAERLPDYAVPRRVQILAEIPIKETLKSDV